MAKKKNNSVKKTQSPQPKGGAVKKSITRNKKSAAGSDHPPGKPDRLKFQLSVPESENPERKKKSRSKKSTAASNTEKKSSRKKASPATSKKSGSEKEVQKKSVKDDRSGVAWKKPEGAPEKYFNRYRFTLHYLSKYCTEQYGKPCSKKELDEMYNEIKNRYYDVSEKNQLPPEEVIKKIKEFVANRNVAGHPPAALQILNWFDIEGLFTKKDGLFFHRDDTIVLDFSVMGMDVYQFPYADLKQVYKDQIYRPMIDRLEELKVKYGKEINSPLPELNYDKGRSDIKSEKRTFTWILIHQGLSEQMGDDEVDEEEEEDDTQGIPSPGKIPSKDPKDKLTDFQKMELENKRSELALKKEELDLKREELSIKRDEVRQSERNDDIKLLERGIMSDAFFKKKWKIE